MDREELKYITQRQEVSKDMSKRNKYVYSLLLAAMVGAVAGCCPGKSDQDRKVESDAAAAKMAQASGASLKLDPDFLKECELTPGVGKVVSVNWDATASHASTVKVLVRGPRDSDKVWTSGGAKGGDKTGPWVFPGTTFTLTDGQDKPLAEVTIQSKVCTK